MGYFEPMLTTLAIAFAVFGSVVPILIAAAMCGFCKRSKPSGMAYSSSHHEASDGLHQPLASNAQSVSATPVVSASRIFAKQFKHLYFAVASRELCQP